MGDGEWAFIEWVRQRTGTETFPSVTLGVGDDCAAIRFGDGQVLITTDMLLDGTHFDSRHHRPEQIGRKAMACSLSDLAAMAARPLGALVAVALKTGGGMEYAQRLFNGMKEIADRFACPIVGGDTTGWPAPAAVCVTMLGECPRGRPPIRRSGAQVQDLIYVTGPLGGSILGRHLTFEPRIELADRLADRLKLHALMDISDGLAIDLWRICLASGVGALLDESLLESVISEDARGLSAKDGVSPLDHALHDGEDFELLVVMPEQEVPSELTESLRVVGRIVPEDLHLRRTNGRIEPIEPRGYEHSL